MKVYKIKVNGKSYRVELESIEENASASAAAPVAKEEKKAETAVPVANAPVSADVNEVTSPIQGSVVRILVKVGDKVKKGTPLVIVEAMKLENEVVSPFDGEVAEVSVSKGQNVTSKQRIALIR